MDGPYLEAVVPLPSTFYSHCQYRRVSLWYRDLTLDPLPHFLREQKNRHRTISSCRSDVKGIVDGYQIPLHSPSTELTVSKSNKNDSKSSKRT